MISALLALGPTIIKGIGSLFGGKTQEVTRKVADAVQAVAGQPPADQATALNTMLAKMTPEEAQAFEQARAQIEQAHAEVLAAQAKAEAAQLQTVNQTMQSESDSKYWLNGNWRALDGVLFAPTILLLYVLLPILHIPTPSIPPDVWIAWGALLGITTWHAGVKDRLAAGDSGSLGAAVGQVIATKLGQSGSKETTS